MVRKIKKTVKKVNWQIYSLVIALSLVGVGVTHLAMARADSMQRNATGTVQSIWPSNNANLTGNTAFIASVNGVAGGQYDMFWYVDNGSWNWMGTSKDSADIKQATVNLGGWNWHSDNSYTITFVSVMHDTKARAYSSLTVHVGDGPAGDAAAQAQAVASAQAAATAATVATQQAAVVVAQQKATAVAAAQTQASSATSILSSLFVDPNNVISQNLAGVSDAGARKLLTRMAGQPMANWYGNWNTDVASDVNGYVSAAAAVNQLPVLVAYNIPGRDCGSYSAGGSASSNAYLSWIQNFANGIGSRSAMVLLEPDALAQVTCLSGGDQDSRYNLLSTAVSILKANPRTKVYIDAGNPTWISVNDMAGRLKQANIATADGFSLNVSNFVDTGSNLTYGKQISAATGGKHFVLDTSRNGNGAAPNNEWCNPSGRALGPLPTTNTGNSLADAYLWVKGPGGSDGECNGGGSAGSWSASLALPLAQNAGWL